MVCCYRYPSTNFKPSLVTLIQAEDENVASLPKKVDAFLRYIDDLYFDGQMDPESKGFFAKNVDGEKATEEKVIFNSDDSTGKAVRHRRKPVLFTE